MPLDIRKAVITALLCLPMYAGANTVNRCEDERGHITFTTLSCPPGQSLTQHNAYNAAPGTRLPEPALQNERQPATQNRELIIVGQRDDGCGNVLNAEQRRRAIINQQTPAGMTRRDVESLLGRPDRIIERNGERRYIYEEKKGRSRQVTFDENGCVKGKR